jgi:hypothetical protein
VGDLLAHVRRYYLEIVHDEFKQAEEVLTKIAEENEQR